MATRKLLKDISIYSLGDVLNKAIQFLLLPLYTRVLSPGDYGKLELVYMVGSVLAIVNGLLVQNAYARLYFDKQDDTYKKRLYGTALLFMVGCSILSLSLGLIFAESIADIMFEFQNGAIYIKLIVVSSLLYAIIGVPEKTLIIQRKPKLYVSVNFINVLITISFTVYFVLILKLNIVGVLLGQIAGRTTRFILMFYFTRHKVNFRFSLDYLYGLLAFSIYLIPSSLSSFVAYFSNRFFLQEYNTLEDVGLFSLAYKMASAIPLLLAGPAKKAFGPLIYSQIGNPSVCKGTIRKASKIMLIGFVFLALALSLFSKEIITIMSDKEYIESYKLVFPLSLSYVLVGVAGIVVTGIQITKKTWLIMFTWMYSAVINVILNRLLVPDYGVYGATFATIITFLIILVSYFIFVEKYYPVHFDYGKYAIILVAFVVLYCVGYVIDINLFIDIICKTILLGLFIFILMAFKLLSPSEKRGFIKIIPIDNVRQLLYKMFKLKEVTN